ncbi:MAG: hypothetical protein IKB34_03150 [Clostridia bacterium]|nr:hypothetical protein [Clostridia bacterium]
MKKTYAVISHTHWDREWYLPFEQFRIRLCDLIDNLLIILKSEKSYRFHLDAQTVVLEDYLEIRPENRSLLKKYIKDGRLLVGPWYVQNDFYLTSGEATVRNLIIGQQIADEFGACMRIGYAADQFGLISQLPQLFRQIGLDSCVFGRGANLPETPPQIYWEGADGSKVYCEFMKWWYNNLQRLPADGDEATKLVCLKVAQMEPLMKTGNYLLMNGVDHLEAQEDLLSVLDEVRQKLPENCEIYQDTLTEFVQRSKKEIEDNAIELDTLKGELRYGGEPTVLTGTLSSRIYLKQANVRAQTALERYVEPIYTLLDGKSIIPYPKEHLTYLWKLLIQNHPHDSICGCSVDSVHRHMMDRFARIKENTDELIRRGMQAIADHVDRKDLTENDYTLTVFNTVPYSGEIMIEAEIMIPDTDNVENFTITRSNGKNVPFVTVYVKDGGYSSLSPINLPGRVNVKRYGVRFMLPINAVGYETLTVRPCGGKNEPSSINCSDPTYMENEYLRCEINENGTLTVTDKTTGKLYHGLMAIEDTEDIGDNYVHTEGENAAVFTSHGCHAEITAIEDNAYCRRRRISFTLKLDRNGEKEIPISYVLTLPANSRALSVDITVQNTAENHRLRALFPTYLKTDNAYAGAPFDCICRPLLSEDRYRRQPNTSYVAFSDGKAGIAILNEGLYEYEHRQDRAGTVAVTLLRSTGAINWSDDRALTPPEWLSPEAQCLGTNTARLAILPFEGSVENSGIFNEAELFIAPPLTHFAPVDMRKLLSGRPFVQSSDINGCVFFRKTVNSDKKLPLALQTVKISGDSGKIVLTACKKAENGCARIIRMYNTSDSDVDFTLMVDKRLRSIAKISPDERLRIQENIPFDGRKIPVKAMPKEIITLEIK